MAIVFSDPEFSSFETIEASLDADLWGVATARICYWASSDANMLSLLDPSRVCPLVTNDMLLCAVFKGGNAKTEEGGVWKVTLNWKGVVPSVDVEHTFLPLYSPSTSAEPIETNPDFQYFAGVPGKPLNNAQFDDQKCFVRFPLVLEDMVTPNPKAGVTSYNMPKLTVGAKSVVDTSNLSRNREWTSVGCIVAPDIDLPDMKWPVDPEVKERDYLLTKVTLEDLGIVGTGPGATGYALMEREWQQSGYWGWNKVIYETVTSSGDEEGGGA